MLPVACAALLAADPHQLLPSHSFSSASRDMDHFAVRAAHAVSADAQLPFVRGEGDLIDQDRRSVQRPGSLPEISATHGATAAAAAAASGASAGRRAARPR